MSIECVPGRNTGDAKYYDRDGVYLGEYEAGVWYPAVTTNNPSVFVIDSIAAANVPEPEPEKKAKPKEPFYAKFDKKRKKDYLRQGR